MMTLFDKPDLLKNRRILLAISASISAYKALDLISSLKKLGAKVRVVMSEESKKFITPLSFEALTHSPVLHADSESWSGDITNPDSKDISCNHISYAKWAELLIIIPASANTYCTNPEQSNPEGVVPPHTYGTPKYFLAISTICEFPPVPNEP